VLEGTIHVTEVCAELWNKKAKLIVHAGLSHSKVVGIARKLMPL